MRRMHRMAGAASLLFLLSCSSSKSSTSSGPLVGVSDTSSTSAWLSRAETSTCVEGQSVTFEHRPDSRHGVAIHLACRDGQVMVSAESERDGTETYPLGADLAMFANTWAAALDEAHHGECITRDEAVAGKKLTDASSVISMKFGSQAMACVSPGGDASVRGRLSGILARTREQFPGPLGSCCSQKPPCHNDAGASCW